MMLLFEQINRVQVLHSLIVKEATGTPDEFAARLHLSKRQLYNILEDFKDMGADIRYNRISKTFYYNNSFKIDITCKILYNDDEINKND